MDGIPVRDTLKECFSCNQARYYNEEGVETELIFFKGNSTEQFGRDLYVYNDAGHKIGSKYFEKGEHIRNYKYTLDAMNRIHEGRAHDITTDTMEYGYRNKYDKDGNHIETATLNSKNEITDYYRRTFNQSGVPITEAIVGLDGKAIFNVKYEYRPQADKDWQEQLTYYNGKLSEIRYREKID